MMDIIKIIQETTTWIEKVNSDFETNLFRTSELIVPYPYYDIKASAKALAVDFVVKKRSELLAKANVQLIPIGELVNYGRLMLFNVDECVVDGAAEVQSSFYVDGDDTPPYDTWISTGGQLNQLNIFWVNKEIDINIIAAWVPKDQYYFAQQAIDVACVDNFEWASNKYIEDDFEQLKSIFDSPEEIFEPQKPINIGKRLQMVQEICANRDLNIDKFNQAIRAAETVKQSLWRKYFQ